MSSVWSLRTALQPGFLAVRKYYRVFLVFQFIGVVLYLAYFRIPPVRTLVDSFSDWKDTGGFLLSALLTAVAGTLLPESVRTLVGPDRSWDWIRLKKMGWNFLFFGSVGLEVDLFYHGLAWLFGSGPFWNIILPKLAVDFLLYVPTVAIPTSVSYFLWLELGWSPRQIWRAWSWSLYRDRGLPLLIPDYFYWGPLLLFLYSLPLNLQFPYFLLIFSGWSLAFVFIGSHGLEKAADK
ncbi:hypothetical protein EBT23_01635 [bacterium]|nr:hypothetical protein [bacterium]